MKEYTMTPSGYVAYLEAVSRRIRENKDYVTQLDAATGDGDHWANLNSGFEKVLQKKDSMKQMTFQQLFRSCGMDLMSGVGGSSGVLYGSAYLAAAKAAAQMETLDVAGLSQVLSAELEAIMARGNAKPGFKTMIDPLYQGTEAMKAALAEGKTDAEVLEALQNGAREGMEATAGMEAVRGRACYQADKGVGHLDPGAVTMYYQLDLLAACMKEGGEADA